MPIALELASVRKVWLAGRNTGHLPRRLLGRDLFDWIWPIASRATADTMVGRRVRERTRHSTDALIGIPERDLAKAGIVRVGRLEDQRGGLPVCGDTVIEPRTIIWCTGFGPDYGWIKLPVLAERGMPRHHRGIASDVPGLYFAGLRFQHRLTSSLLGGVGADAAFIAAQVANRVEVPVTA